MWIWPIHGSCCAIYGSLLRAGIHGSRKVVACVICGFCQILRMYYKSLHYSNPSLAQTYYMDRLLTFTKLYNPRNTITDSRRRNSLPGPIEHAVTACTVQGLTLAMCPLARVHFLGCRASSGHNNSFSAGPRGQ